MLGTDPLKIYYLVVLETADPHDTTTFQGFSLSWSKLHWALHLLTTMPADVLEKSYKLDDVIAHRMGDLRPLYWLPISISTLEEIDTDDIGVFIVCFSGEQGAAERVAVWAAAQPHPVLHVSTVQVDNALHVDAFGHDRLRQYCLDTLAARPAALSPDRLEAATNALAKWAEPGWVPSGLRERRHNILLPNHMSLRRAARLLDPGEPFIGRNEAEYTRAILESVSAVFAVREAVGIRPLHRLTLLTPEIILSEPAFFRHGYKRIRPPDQSDKPVIARTLRMLQTQKRLHNETDTDYLDQLRQSPAAQSLIAARQSELETHTLGVGLKAAQTCSAVMRLSPGVNHVFPALSNYARNVRSRNIEARLKTRKLFDAIQNDLKAAVGEERLSYLQKKGGPLKIVSDAPIEWLPVGNLPLSLRYDCSRINATPGNLMMALLTNAAPLTFQPSHLQKILVLSSFTDDDPLKNVLTGSLDAIREQWDSKVAITFRKAATRAEFVEALNAFDGYIVVFDGHGVDNAEEPVGKLILGNEPVDVWDLRGSVRVPPIVILSACDTQGIDASSHATVGNGFLALGARTVLATLLPVGGVASASFIARLVYRIADFLPAVLRAEKRVLNWTEVIAGMLRMLLASEMLDALVGPPAPSESPRGEIQTATNMDINTGDENWFDNLLDRIAKHRGDTRETVEAKARSVLVRSEAIRYLQLGNPETILIDDGTIVARVMKEYSGTAPVGAVPPQGITP